MTVFILPNLKKQHSYECTKQVIDIMNGLGCRCIMSQKLDDEIDDRVEILSTENAAKLCDIIITIGGDGTILKIASLAALYGKKLLGINCGRLGFMASLERGELDKLNRLVTKDFKTESRMMLDASIVKSDGSVSKKVTALNDIVITHGFNYNINDFTVWADGVKVSSLRADGLIFSTPTGASAYSLSAGGPLIEPSMDCIEFTQICPHSLFARTMLFSADKELEVRYTAEGTIGISADGESAIPVDASDRLFIKKSNLRLDLIDICGNNYFKSIGSKLMQPAKEI